MKLSFFVTCGRGLDDFVKTEISEKIPGVMEVHSLGEGKIAFTIQSIDATTSPGDAQRQTSDKIDKAQQAKLNNENIFNTDAIVFIYDLKLIERVFLTLHCETTDSNSIDETKLQAILNKTDFDFIASLVSRLKMYQVLQEEEYKGCCKPDSCPGFITKKAAKEEIKEKRFQATKNKLGDFELKRVSVKRQGPFCDHEERVRKWKKNENIRESQRLVCEKHFQTAEPTHNCGPLFESSSVKESKPHSEINFEKSKVGNHKYSMKTTFADEKIIDHKLNKALLVRDGLSTSIAEKNNKIPEKSSSVQKDSSKAGSKSQERVEKMFPLTYRISCRITGKHKKHKSSASFTAKFVEILQNVKSHWATDWTNPALDFYVNITDSYFILGVTLSRESRSLRSYIAHITLRSTIAHLIGKLCCIKSGDVLYDPMCGGGTILAEAGKCFKAGLIVGGDQSEEQIEIARCNLCRLGIPYGLIVCQSTSAPLKNSSVDAVVCDFPFGQKHRLMEDEKTLLRVTLGECCRLLVSGGRAVFLLSSQQISLLPQLLNSSTKQDDSDNRLRLEATHPLSLGRTFAFVAVLVK